MGQKKSKLLQFDDDIKTLKNELQTLKDLDKNQDGTITKNEFISWKNEQKVKMIDLEQKIEEQLNNKYAKILSEKDSQLMDSKNKIEELTKQINALKNMNTGLENKISHANSNNQNKDELNKLQELSKIKVDEFVEKLLNDENVNIGYLPDFVERQIYKNVFNLIIGLLNNTLSTTSVKLLGHELTFMITPEPEPQPPPISVEKTLLVPMNQSKTKKNHKKVNDLSI